MPVPQFDQFEMLDGRVMAPNRVDEIEKFWRQLSQERDHYLDGLDDYLNLE